MHEDRVRRTTLWALAGGVGFLLATLSTPVAAVVANATGPAAFPVFFAIPGAIVGAALAVAGRGAGRRAILVGQGTLGIVLGAAVGIASGDAIGLWAAALAGAIVGVFVGVRTAAGALVAAVVGSCGLLAVFPIVEWLEGFAGIGAVSGVAFLSLWGAALGAVAGWFEDPDAGSAALTAFGRVVRLPAAVAGALLVLVSAQVSALVVALRKDPPSLCFEGPRVVSATLSLAVADLDGDGDLDGVGRMGNDDRVAVLRNDGRGTLSPEPSLAGIRPATLARGDIDGDGDVDVAAIVVEPRKLPGEPARWGLLVARNDGHGTLTAGPMHALQPETWILTVGDLDGDGAADVVVTDTNGPLTFRSRGGALEPGPRLEVRGRPVIADVDGDRRAEILTVAGRGGVAVHRRSGAGFEASTVPVMVDGSVTDVTAGDLDRDGDTDLVVGADEQLVLLANNGTGGFVRVGTLPGGGENVWVTTGDLDGDGDLDVVASEGPSGEERPPRTARRFPPVP